jgi:peptide/nickel transport system permease protein
MVALVLIGGLASALLVRYSPGALVDERELDQRLNQQSVAAVRAERAADQDVVPAFLRYLQGMVHGDLGYSRSRQAPITQLIAERAPETIHELALGLLGGWLLGLGLAIPAGRYRQAWIYDAFTATAAGLLLAVPASLLAYLCLVAGAKSAAVLVLVLAPRIFRFARNMLVQGYGSLHVEMARARGVREAGILARHVLPAAAPQILALAAASAGIAFGAAIPVEVICDVPGLGRLAWQAAMARDLPLLVNLTMLTALGTMAAMAISETASRRERAPA